MIIYFIDLDGTIENSKLDMSLCVNKVRKNLNLVEHNLEYIEPFVNQGMNDLYHKCFSDFILNNKNGFEIIKNEYELCYFKHVSDNTKCYDGIPESIEQLAKNGKVVVITNKPEHISRELLNKLSLSPFITDIMGGDSCAECKPNPLPLHIAAKKLNFNPEVDQSFMIGDSNGDIQVAKAFGAQSVWCSWGYLKELPKLKPDIIINSPLELKSLCQKIHY